MHTVRERLFVCVCPEERGEEEKERDGTRDQNEDRVFGDEGENSGCGLQTDTESCDHFHPTNRVHYSGGNSLVARFYSSQEQKEELRLRFDPRGSTFSLSTPCIPALPPSALTDALSSDCSLLCLRIAVPSLLLLPSQQLLSSDYDYDDGVHIIESRDRRWSRDCREESRSEKEKKFDRRERESSRRGESE
jgi:hypothetical protein